MDIPSVSMGMQQASCGNSVQISVMKMVMNSNEVINNEMTKMIGNMASNENLGNNLDVTV